MAITTVIITSSFWANKVIAVNVSHNKGDLNARPYVVIASFKHCSFIT
jgi:hypothetical protein